MAIQRKRIDITSADSKQLGFEYQYLYFILRLLTLSKGDEIGYEVLDDVHTISDREKKTYLYQLKHTIETTSLGEQVNLTELSEDLWKTLSNWSKLISDPSEGRTNKKAQKQFVEKTGFILVVNRKTYSNKLLSKMIELKKGNLDSSEFIDYIKQLKNKSENQAIKENIDNVISLGVSVLSGFVKNVEVVNSPDNLFESIRDGIRDKMVPENYVNNTFADLYMQLKEDFFDKVSNGQHQIITYDDWRTRYQAVFNQYRTTLLPLREYAPQLPEHLEEQYFVKELIEIDAIDIKESGLADIAEYTNQYLSLEMQLEDLCQEGQITSLNIKQFDTDAVLEWQNIHKKHHRKTKRNIELNYENALNCFDDVMLRKLTLLSTDLGMGRSNGEFIKLANEQKIGWKYVWKDRYLQNDE